MRNSACLHPGRSGVGGHPSRVARSLVGAFSEEWLFHGAPGFANFGDGSGISRTGLYSKSCFV
ncbi:hypothetical protein FOPG_18174 [Fusarium oxysporum f. sp. conglutinans race 2 54008]|uniref:Uncharacterized protein n=1 Tax=Fusarium oxysporum f. sp. conglutinans race 2 54008 TaxID=1089457 RepID=X0GQK6_FUSOX|nr:hypothetical protein FOPG_18174 [Fusarium oxysporum f. sp. conglutinans race 2 54008]